MTRICRINNRERCRQDELYEIQHMRAAIAAQPRLAAGQGLLPETSGLFSPGSLAAELIYAAVQLFSQALAHSRAALALPAPAAGQLAGLDGAVTRIIQQFMPWNLANGATVAPPAAPATTLSPPAAQQTACYRIHQAGNNALLLRQQVNEFLQRMDWREEEPLVQWLVEQWQQWDMIFIYPEIQPRARSERAHVDEMRRRTLLHEMTLRDQSLAEGGVGVRIIAWADEHTEKGYTLFRQGVENYNPLNFLASGGEILLGYFARTAGEIYGGTILDRQPGESKADWLRRLTLNVIMPPDAAAAKAFGAKALSPVKPVRPVFTPAMNPRASLPGTVISHLPSGITLHSTLQGEINGQRWHLHPVSGGRGIALQSGQHPAINHAAVLSQQNRWRIEGVAGEHRFTHDKSPQWLVRSGQLWYPVKLQAEDGLATLPDGQQIYFHQLSQQWRHFYPLNRHLHPGVLSILPLAAGDVGPVLATIGHPQAEIWCAPESGAQYLKVRAQSISGADTETTYVAGRLEGAFFTLWEKQHQPIYRQRVLKWHVEKQQWQRADSPFSLLQAAEEHIDLSWLRQVAQPQINLVAVRNRPGLYRFAKEYFLRWQTDEHGAEEYLPLLSTVDAFEYRTPVAGAESELHFRYHQVSGCWQFLPLTSEAFFGLPPAVKVQFSQPLSGGLDLAEYRHLYFRGDDIFLHTGSDSQGRPDYIQVEQDAADNDVFSLKVAEEAGTPSRFRYDGDDEFVLEDQRRCLPRVKRADNEQPCAGPSGINPASYDEASQPPKKKQNRMPLPGLEVQIWLDGQLRSPDELLRAGDNRLTKARKNLSYALRLCLCSPKEVSISRVAQHARVTVRRLSALLSKTSPETCYFLIGHPARENESVVDYALRLYQHCVELTPRIIADYTGANESKIVRKLEQLPFDTLRWLRLHPRHPLESSFDYALRLFRSPEGGGRISIIAAHAGVSEQQLMLSAAAETGEGQRWLNGHLRYAGETNIDYALRLYQMTHEDVTIEMLATHAGVEKTHLLQRLGQKWKDKLDREEATHWLNGYPRIEGETNFAYAWRLAELRDAQVLAGSLIKKTIKNNMIALHASITPRTFSSRLYESKLSRQWCNNHPRLPAERLAAAADSVSAMEINKRYVLRLMKLRHREPMKRQAKLKPGVIAHHAGISETQLNLWMYATRQEWFSSIVRQGNEISYENTDELTVQRNNQFYARRMTARREQEDMAWLVTDQHIASWAGVTLHSFKLAQEPRFGLDEPRVAPPFDSEYIWEPDSGLLHLQLKQNPPLLTDPKDPQRSVTKEVITSPVTITNLPEIVKPLSKAARQEVAERLLLQAQELVDSDGSRQDYFYDQQGNKQPGLLSHKLQIFHNEQSPHLGMQIIAKEEFEPYELIGVYTGSWHADEISLRNECKKMGSQSVYTYLWGVYKGEQSVSAWQNANKLALINTAELATSSSSAASEPKLKNNLAVMYINDRLPAYYTTEKIAKGEPLLISYGDYYMADYQIQSALNNDIVRIIARSEQCYFLIKGTESRNVCIMGPAGPLEQVPDGIQPFILKERLDKRGILRYDALGKKGGKRIAISNDDENNLYHAMAKSMSPRGGLDIINEKINQMKNSVAAAHAEEESLIKPEPAETHSLVR